MAHGPDDSFETLGAVLFFGCIGPIILAVIAIACRHWGWL